MPNDLKELDWSSPVLPAVADREWEVTVRKFMGIVPDIMTRVSPSGWLRVMMLKAVNTKAAEIPGNLADIATLVCSQENACRFCYGIARAQMRFFGYSDKMISSIEQDMLMAELDKKDRAFIKFCRSLARSNPRPLKVEMDRLLEFGFTPLQATEAAFHVVRVCFTNRVTTFISSPLMLGFERLPDKFLGRLLRPLIARFLSAGGYTGDGSFEVPESPFAHIIKPLAGLPTAASFLEGIEGAFASTVLSKDLKVLMFAVVARSLNCSSCGKACSNLAQDIGFTVEEYVNALSALKCTRLNDQEQLLLAWTRETVHYQTEIMQLRIKELSNQVDSDRLLEAIGVAALANSIVRLGVLLE